MNTSEVSPIILEKAPIILAEIKKANNILLHCHPSPDPDSVGSALAMKFALEQLGKRATVIKGDSEIPQAFMHFPGAKDIVQKNFFEVDLKEFELFIAVDAGGLVTVSRKGEVIFPSTLKVIVIDHHQTNGGFGSINLIEPSYPANCQVLFDLFQIWGIEMNSSIAANLFIGMYTDTGAFKWTGVNHHTFDIVRQLSLYIKDLPRLIADMENSNTPGFLAFEGLALSNIKLFCGGIMAVAVVSKKAIEDILCPNENGLCINLSNEDIRSSEISSFMRTVPGWQIAVCAVETEYGMTKFSFRSGSKSIYDVSKLASSVGGGGHKFASGAVINKPIDEAVSLVVAKAKELYNL